MFNLSSSTGHFVLSNVGSFVYSFTFSIYLTGDFKKGLKGAFLGALATTIHVVFMKTLTTLNVCISRHFNKQAQPIDFEGRHCAILTSWGATLFLARALSIPIFYKMSFILTFPYYLAVFIEKDFFVISGIVVI